MSRNVNMTGHFVNVTKESETRANCRLSVPRLTQMTVEMFPSRPFGLFEV